MYRLTLTDAQFASFETLCRVMDTGGQTPEQCAVNAHAIGIPWRYISTLTGLTGDAIQSAVRRHRAALA